MTEPRVSGAPELITAALICFCAGGLYGWSALIPVIENQFGGSTEQSGLVFSVAIVAFSIAVIVLPHLTPNLTGLRGCVVFGCCGAVCLTIASMASGYLTFLIAFGAGFGISSGAIYISALVTAAQSFKPAVITPLMVASFGMGGAVYGLLWHSLVANGWATNALMPLVISLVVACLTGFLISKKLPAVNTATTDKPSYLPSERLLSKHFHFQQPLAFTLLWFTFALGSAGGLMVLGLAGKITDSVGASANLMSIAIAGVAIGNTIGRLSVSGFNYVFKPVNTAMLAVVVAALGLIVMALAKSSSLVVSGLITVAAGYGAVASTIPALVGEIYGKENFARAFSFVFSAWGVTGLIAPWLAGVVHDQTGDFQMAIVIALLATMGAAVALLLLKFVTLK